MNLLTPQEIAPASEALNQTLEQMNRMLLGRDALHRLVLTGILARGHILLEGLPGLGKTALVKAVADILRLRFKRIQFTPDLMPGDILGSHILQQTASGARDLVFQPGPVFCNVLLADEINRASPKTQSAMLETMQERTVTLLGTTRALPAPFFVLASQNPIELEGTYPLPEAQLDRFLFRLNVGDLPAETLLDILTGRRHGTVPEASWTLPQETLEQCFATVDRVALPEAVARWIARLVTATHPGAAEATPRVRTYVRYGASPRAAIALAEAARAAALLAGRPSVGFEDVKMLVEPVLNHRLILNYQARLDQVTASALSQELAAALDPAGMRLPQGVEVKA
jgi:MoxR-like ATPase